MKKEKNNLNNQGITLMALIVTIVIMLILAAVSFGVIYGGLFNYARSAKLSSEDAKNLERIQNAYLLAKGKSKSTVVDENELQRQVDIALPDKDATVAKEGNGFVVLIGDKYYEITNNGIVNAPQTLKKIENAGDITKGGTCTGTEDNPYRIECIEDLVKLAELTNKKDSKIAANKYYLLVNDLDFNSIFSYSNYKAKYIYNSEADCYEPDLTGESGKGIKELCTTGQGFIPIGLEYSNNNTTQTFRGIFYGEEQREIRNIYINRSGVASLFGAGVGVTIENITVDGNIKSTSSYATGIIGNSYGTTIRHCYNKAKVEGKTSAAGIYYNGGANITECGNEGEITAGNGIAAGISITELPLKKCYNKGKIKSGLHAAGICGHGLGGTPNIVNCYNTGTVTAGTDVCCAAGITYWKGSPMYNCYNTGEITGACVQKNSARYGIGRSMSNCYKLCCKCNKLLFFRFIENY